MIPETVTSTDDDSRTAHLVTVLTTAFEDLMDADPDAFRVKFSRPTTRSPTSPRGTPAATSTRCGTTRRSRTTPSGRSPSTPRRAPSSTSSARAGSGSAARGCPRTRSSSRATPAALDNDVILTMKQGNVAAPVLAVPQAHRQEGRFHHHGHRTALSQRALQAHADRFLGWTELDVRGTGPVGFVVSEYSPYEQDLEWDDITEPDEVAAVVEQLGRATAKIHCVSDVDSDSEIVDFSVEHAVAEGVGDRGDAFVADLVEFGRLHADRARRDHRLFVDAFRSGAFDAVTPTSSASPAG